MGLEERKEEAKGKGTVALQGGGTTSVMDALQKAKDSSAAPGKEEPKVKGIESQVPETLPTKRSRQKVDDEWIAGLVSRANESFGSKIPPGSRIEFNIAKSKGRPVSLTPRIILEDGGIQAAGPKNRIGFCTDSQWGSWEVKLQDALDAAMSKPARVKGSSSRSSSSRPSRWTHLIGYVRDRLDKEIFGAEEIKLKSVGKRLTISRETEDDDRALKLGLKRDTEDSEVVVSAATGEVRELKPLLMLIHDALQIADEVPEG